MNTMKSLLSTFLLSTVILFNATAQKDPAAKKILDAMSAKYKSIPSFNASFTYTMENEGEDINEGFEGTILVKGDKYKLIMTEQEVSFDGTNIYTFLKEENEVTIAESDPEDGEISISNIFNIYKTGYKYLYKESKNNGKIDVVDLVPEDREKDYFKIRMEIEAGSNELKNFMVFDKSGSRYVYTIVTFEVDSSITDSEFVFDTAKFPKVEVIDFR